MISASTIKHLRIPFSLFLMPIFVFALANAQPTELYNVIIAFIVLHIFIYPASNGYNSYFDKDEGSIGGLKHPPKVTKDLYTAALIFDGIGIGLAFTINIWFAIMIFAYGLISKAYSHPKIRLKKYPIISWLTVGLFQGAFTYLMAMSALTNSSFEIWLEPHVYIPAIVSTLLVMGSYPMTQIYQHEEDTKRGDRTISVICGIRGTFYLTAFMFLIGMAGFYYYLSHYQTMQHFWMILAVLAPVFIYFNYWFLKVYNDEDEANFEHTMRFNLISAIFFIGYFAWYAFL